MIYRASIDYMNPTCAARSGIGILAVTLFHSARDDQEGFEHCDNWVEGLDETDCERVTTSTSATLPMRLMRLVKSAHT